MSNVTNLMPRLRAKQRAQIDFTVWDKAYGYDETAMQRYRALVSLTKQVGTLDERITKVLENL